MSRRPVPFTLGLVVGKFAPLHAGHLHLIDSAAAQCERLLLLSWCHPEPARCEASTRRRWLHACRPQHEAWVFDDASLAQCCAERGITPQRLPPDASDDETQQQFLAWLLADVLQRRPDAMFASEDYLLPCAQRLSQRFGHAVAPVMVDRTRSTVPISASRIRQQPVAHRQHLPAPVWADWVPRVCLLGGESSGKSTLAQALAERHHTLSVAEYGRELWERQGGVLQEPDLLHIAEEQVRREDAAAARAGAFLACDTSPLTTLFYALDQFGRADPALVSLADRRYDLHVLCEPDFPFVQDGTRRDAAFRQRQTDWYSAQLAQRGITPLRVFGPVEHRLRLIEVALTLA
ncbi:AAA family ATPase [Piscinibacter sp. HJYY11]|uniref:AAA family ATPase n=1 Tax=Piscinibacter sp. HJYY11 TaxID=2801333 RepID=UPI00191F1001|nr:AAA family ATPase [Piscinibacter sp. HJYY11]MBL0728645.1 AAA family ATPase [Piscinibacter sp. HJYY11]